MSENQKYTLLHASILNSEPSWEKKPAVLWPTGALTYNQFRESTIRIASRLHLSGIGKGSHVAVCLPKCVEAVQAIMGTLVSGATYIPMDAASSPSRLLEILRDSRANLFITTEKIMSQLKAANPSMEIPSTVSIKSIETGKGLDPWIADVHRVEPPEVGLDDTAAIFYTTRSTDDPRGVMLSHRNLSSFVHWAITRFGLNPNDRFTSRESFHSILSTFDLFASLHLGASVFLVTDKLAMFPPAVAQAVRENRCSLWYSMPTALRLLIEHGRIKSQGLPSLRLIFFAGEAFPASDLHNLMHLLPHPQYVNLYGSVETNVCAYYPLPDLPEKTQAEIPIGLPCEHMDVSLRGKDGEILPPGQAGEVYIAGPSVMQGYWQQPDATTSVRFDNRDDSFRTGDFAYRRENGVIHFLGRRDRQVKIRSHQMELSEIENVLASHPGVRQAVILLNKLESQEPRLIAYIIPSAGHKVSPSLLRNYCSSKLPSHAVPSLFIIPDHL